MTIADWPADAGIDIASEIANMPEGATTRRGVVIFGVSGTLDEAMESAFEAGADDPHGLPNLPRAAKVDSVTYEIARDGSVTCSEGYEPLVQDGKLAFRRTSAAPRDLFADIAEINAWFEAHNGVSQHEDAIRVMKIMEECGEAVEAYIGMTGQNPRKGITHTLDDLLLELCDVALSAMCAIQHFTQDIEATRNVMLRKSAIGTQRVAAFPPTATP